MVISFLPIIAFANSYQTETNSSKTGNYRQSDSVLSSVRMAEPSSFLKKKAEEQRRIEAERQAAKAAEQAEAQKTSAANDNVEEKTLFSKLQSNIGKYVFRIPVEVVVVFLVGVVALVIHEIHLMYSNSYLKKSEKYLRQKIDQLESAMLEIAKNNSNIK